MYLNCAAWVSAAFRHRVPVQMHTHSRNAVLASTGLRPIYESLDTILLLSLDLYLPILVWCVDIHSF